MNQIKKHNPNTKLSHWKSYVISSADRAYLIKLKPSAFVIFEWLCFHCTPNTNRIQVDNKIIAEALKYSEVTVYKSLQILEKSKFIKETNQVIGGKLWEINVYFISKGQEYWKSGVWYEPVEVAPEEFRKSYLMEGVAVVNTYNVVEKIK